jgi:hypothetical protein
MAGWFEGVETIIHEHGMWPERGLRAQYGGFKYKAGQTDCCCHHILFCQPDFVHRNLTLKNTSHCAVTSVTFTQNSTVSSILLSSTGEQLNSAIGLALKLLTSTPWNPMSLHALTMSHSCKLDTKFNKFVILLVILSLI